MNRDEYRNVYLRSEHWRNLRRRVLGDECYCCGMNWKTGAWNQDDNGNTTELLELHHISYKNLGKPGEDNDVITVCASCHDHITAIIGYKNTYIHEIGNVEVTIKNAHILYKLFCDRSLHGYTCIDESILKNLVLLNNFPKCNLFSGKALKKCEK